jgi:hypothetical protein
MLHGMLGQGKVRESKDFDEDEDVEMGADTTEEFEEELDVERSLVSSRYTLLDQIH